MRLQTTIRLHLPTEALLRQPTIWDRVRTAFGGKVDLTSDRARPMLQATAIVDQGRTALRRLGVNNAVSLVVDDTVLFNDTEGKPDDLGDVMLAMADYAPIVSSGFRSIRFASEHEQAGLHFVIEIHALGEHGKEDAAAMVYVGARVLELEAKREETGEAYRARVEPLIASPGLLDGSRRQFEAFVARLGDALRAAFPEARVVEEAAEVKVVKPAPPGAEPPRPQPGHPAYDPYANYYPSPAEHMLSSVMLYMFISSAFHPPFIHVVHPSGAPIASADQLAGHDAELAPEAPDPGAETGGAGDDLGAGAGDDYGDGGGDDFGGDGMDGGFGDDF